MSVYWLVAALAVVFFVYGIMLILEALRPRK